MNLSIDSRLRAEHLVGLVAAQLRRVEERRDLGLDPVVGGKDIVAAVIFENRPDPVCIEGQLVGEQISQDRWNIELRLQMCVDLSAPDEKVASAQPESEFLKSEIAIQPVVEVLIADVEIEIQRGVAS